MEIYNAFPVFQVGQGIPYCILADSAEQAKELAETHFGTGWDSRPNGYVCGWTAEAACWHTTHEAWDYQVLVYGYVDGQFLPLLEPAGYERMKLIGDGTEYRFFRPDYVEGAEASQVFGSSEEAQKARLAGSLVFQKEA